MHYTRQVRARFERKYKAHVSFKKETEQWLLFDNQAEIWSLPNNPRTIEGLDCSAGIIDEAGNFQGREGNEIYEALMGSLAAKNGSMTIFGKPRGRNGFFWDLYDPFGDFVNQFKRYEFPYTVRAKHDKNYAKAVKEHKERMTPLAFRENYLCEFADEGIVIFPYSLLDKQKRSHPMWRLGKSVNTQNPVYGGMDFGKKHDKTAVTFLEHGDVKTRTMFHETTNKPFNEQIDWFCLLIDTFKPQKLFVDETGMGLPILDILEAKYPGVVEGVVFTSQVKEKMVLSTRNLLADGRLEIPDDDMLIQQLHGIEKVILESGRIRYTGKRTDTDWLDDQAWSLFLACSQLGDASFEFIIADSETKVQLTPLYKWTHDLDDDGNPL